MATFTVGTGQDYTTLALWEDAQDDTGLTEDQIVECYGGSNLGMVLIAGWTMNGYRITIRPASGHRHIGVWDTSKAYVVGTGFQFDGVIGSTTENVTIQGMQVAAGGTVVARGIRITGANSIVEGNLVRGNVNTGNDYFHAGIFSSQVGAKSSTIRNNLVIDWYSDSGTYAGGGMGIWSYTEYDGGPSGQQYIRNNTVINCDVGIHMEGDGSGKSHPINNIVANIHSGGTAYEMVPAGAVGTSAYNVSEDGTGPGGTGEILNTTVGFTNEGTISSGLTVGYDFSLSSDIEGQDLSAASNFPFSNDLLAGARSTPWSRGAFEFGGTPEPVAGMVRTTYVNDIA